MPVRMSIEIDVDGLVPNSAGATAAIENILDRVATEAMTLTLDETVRSTPVQTGKLVASWRIVRHDRGDRSLINSQRYAGFVHDGQVARDVSIRFRRHLAEASQRNAKQLGRAIVRGGLAPLAR